MALSLSCQYAPMKGTSEAARAREPSLVLLHGLTSGAPTFGNVLQELSAVAHVFAVDLRGHGGSPDPAFSPSDPAAYLAQFAIPAMAADVAAFIETVVFGEHGVSRDIGAVHVLGHSWGSRVAGALAMDSKTQHLVASLIFEDEHVEADPRKSDAATEELAAHKAARAKAMWRNTFASTDAAVAFCTEALNGVVAAYERKVVPVDPENPSSKVKLLFKPHVSVAFDYNACPFATRAAWDGSAGYKRPMLIIGAGADEGIDVTQEHREKLAAEAPALSEAHGFVRRFVHIPGSGHSIHRTHPAEFVAALSEFVASAALAP